MLYNKGEYITRTIDSLFTDNDVLVGVYRVTKSFECTTKIDAWEVMDRDPGGAYDWGSDFFRWLESCGYVEALPFHEVLTYDRGDRRLRVRVRG